MSKRITATARLVGVDSSIVSMFLIKVWQMLSGPVSIMLVAHTLSQYEQGFYYTFSSLIALQVFLELGAGQCIMQFISHEAGKISIGPNCELTGDPGPIQKIQSVSNFGFKWFSVASIAFVVIITPVGALVLSNDSPVHWFLPWLLLVLSSAAHLSLQSIWSTLEGYNQIPFVSKSRFLMGVANTLGVWIGLYCGLKLYAVPLGSALNLAVECFRLIRYKKGVIRQLVESRTAEYGEIARELFALQYRLAASWVSGYIIFNSMIPIVFQTLGPVQAGKLGMTWTIIQALNGISSIWVGVKSAMMGQLAGKKLWKEMDKLLFHSGIRSILTYALGVSTGALGLYIFRTSKFLDRLLEPKAILLLCLGIAASLVMNILSIYLRAFKKEPYMVLSIGNGIACFLSIYFGTKFGGITLMAGLYALSQICAMFYAIYVFKDCKAKWCIS